MILPPLLLETGNWKLETLLWSSLALLCLLFSAIAAGSEIGLFALSKVRLRLRTHQRDPRAMILSQWLIRPTNALEGFLVIQNITSFIFSACITNILTLAGFGPVANIFFATLIITPLILILADIAPKDLFNVHADRWIYPLVPIFRVVFKILTIIPILPLIRVLSRATTFPFRKKIAAGKDPHSPAALAAAARGEIVTLLEESTATGVISSAQQDIVQRALRLARITVRDVMIPWPQVIGVPLTISRDGFRALIRRYPVSRVPVLGKSPTDVLGFVETFDVLSSVQSPVSSFQPETPSPSSPTPTPNPPPTPLPNPNPHSNPNPSPSVPTANSKLETGNSLSSLLRPHMTLIGEQDVRSAITLLQRAKQTLAIVIDRTGRAIGLVTLKDLIEQLVGDLESW